MKKNKIINILVVMILVYVTFNFILKELNALNWSIYWRMMYCTLGIGGSTLLNIMANISESHRSK